MRNAVLLTVLCFAGSLYAQKPAIKTEFRGIWITTAYNLDWPSSATLTPKQQQQEFIELLDRHQKNGINTVIVQVRAAADAFYKSDYEPWSYWLTGEQGKAPTPFWDPLEFMVAECHKRNMELHAWFNLFRAVSHDKFFKPVKDHAINKNPDWTFKIDNKSFFDPGVPEVRNYLTAVVTDCVKKYDIDGVHLDDYFYPQESKKETIDDAKTFKKYGKGFDNIGDWRRDNINKLIKQLSESIHKTKTYVKFGISPAPVWRHKSSDKNGSETDRTLTCYDDLYADSRKWIQEGWIDYLIPQLYWSTKHKRVNFAKLLEWYGNNTFNHHIYAGLAYYKLSDTEDEGWKDPSQILEQIKLVRENTQIGGYCFFRSASFNNNPHHMEDSIRKNINSYYCIPPPMPWLDSIPTKAPISLTYSQDKQAVITLNWKTPLPAVDGELPYVYIIYRTTGKETLNIHSSANIIGMVKENKFIDNTVKAGQSYTYYITSTDRLHNESYAFTGISTRVKR